MSKKIMGKTEIELTNVRTGKKEVYEDHNMLTGHLSKILSINPWGMIKPASLMPLVGRVLGGVALFPEKKEENVNNDILFNDFTAYAQLNANGTTDTRRGSWNYTESGPLTGTQDGYKLVWDFTTSQGNGTYNCIALTHPKIDQDRTAFPPVTSCGSSYGYDTYNSFGNGVDTDSYNLLYLPQAYDNETGIFYRLVVDSTTQLKIHKGRRPISKILLDEIPFYGSASSKGNNPAELVDGVTEAVHDYENRAITLTNAVLTSSYLNSCSFRREDDVPYMYIFSIPTASSASFHMTKINLDTYAFEETTMTYSGATFKANDSNATPRPEIFPLIGDYIYLPKKNDSNNNCTEAFYKANITDTSDITAIAIPEEIQSSGANGYFANQGCGYIMKNDYGYWWIKRRAYNSNTASTKYTIGICNDEMILLGSIGLYNYCTYTNASHNIENTWIEHFNNSSNANYCIPEMNTYYLLSINNLASPITKTSEQLMKITYTLTEVDE